MPDLSRVTCIEDLRQLHRARVPRMFYDYCDSGSWSEGTWQSNAADLKSIQLRQRVAVNVQERHTRSTILGKSYAMPVAIAPTGLAGMQHADGEILGALAAKDFGVPFTLSTMSTCSLEDVAKATGNHPFMFQLYVMRDRTFVEQLIERARQAHCDVLQLTLDLPIIGQRHKDIKNRLTAPPKLSVSNMINMLGKPAWSLGMLGTHRRSFGNIVGHAKGVHDISAFAAWTQQQFDASLTWKDVTWIKKIWGGKLVLKGILDAEDARIAAQCGADAIVVSNHGGRQLDGAPSSIRALPRIVDAVGSKMEVWMDGGVMSGQDVLKARALGAQAVMIGRAWLHGVGAAGQAGVTKALQIIQKELDLTMAFCGCTSIDEVNSQVLFQDIGSQLPTR